MLHQKLILTSFVSCILLLVSPVQASNSNQPTNSGSICCCIFFNSEYILMEHFTVLVRDGSHVSRGGGGIQVVLQEMEFQRHVAPQGTVREK